MWLTRVATAEAMVGLATAGMVGTEVMADGSGETESHHSASAGSQPMNILRVVVLAVTIALIIGMHGSDPHLMVRMSQWDWSFIRTFADRHGGDGHRECRHDGVWGELGADRTPGLERRVTPGPWRRVVRCGGASCRGLAPSCELTWRVLSCRVMAPSRGMRWT
jgi:hypothetical protein